MICPKCNTDNSNDYAFCMHCGAALTATTEDLSEQSLPEQSLPSSNIAETLPPPSSKFSAAAENLSGRTLDGKYQIEAKLGTGGAGAVYLATRLHIGDKVAVKVLRNDKGDTAQTAERFRLEAQMAAHLKHPNAVGVYDYGLTADGLRFLVMEFVEGKTLRQLISQQGALPATLTAEINAQICSALNEAHRIGLIHRDIKPDNIIVQETPAGLRVKVLDFGIAKLSSLNASNLTQPGTIVGTPRYMSPEQCMGEQLDGRSDIYSLGVVLYEMLCGIVPFNAPTSTAIAVQQVTHPPPSLRQVNPTVSPAVESVILRALEKKREARQPTAAELAAQLTAAANNQTQLTSSNEAFNFGANQTSQSSQTTSTSGSQPTVFIPSYTGSTQFEPPNFLTAGQTLDKKQKNLPLLITAAILGVLIFGGIGIAAVWLWLRPETEVVNNNQNNISNNNATNNKNSSDTNSKNINATPSVNPADDELMRLRNERFNAAPGKTSALEEKLEDAEKKYPNDYRFPFERALLIAPSSNHHLAYSALSEAATTAIKNNQAAQMLSDLNKGKNTDFRRISSGHKEWMAIENALNQKDATLLPKKDEH